MQRIPERRIAPAHKWEGPADRRVEFESRTSFGPLDLAEILKEPEFQELVELASQICDTPISLITVLDTDMQWITSAVGTDVTETTREVSFCTHAIKTPNIFVVEDATKHPLFMENPLVTDGLRVRFYAGIPIAAPEGAPFGTLCIIDTKAREMTEREKASLAIIARQVHTRLELRAKNLKLEATIAENDRLSETLRETNELFLTFMNNAPLASYIKDADGRMLFYNTALATQFDVNEDEWIGRTDHEIWSPEIANALREHDRRVLASDGPAVILETTDGKSGNIHWKSYKFPFRNRRGEKMLAGMSLDVTADVLREAKLAEQNRELEALAGTDALTGLPNRRIFEEAAGAAFMQALDEEDSLSLLVLDIDDFKRRNDRYGHAAGDHALRLLGEMLTGHSHGCRLAARLGGEEFGMVLPGMDAREARQFAQMLSDEMLALDPGQMQMTASIGVATLDATASDWQRLLARADDAMYEAKRNGKNQVMLHEDLLAKLLTESQRSASLARAAAPKPERVIFV